MNNRNIACFRYNSPCGTLLVGVYEDKLCLCDWIESKKHASNIKRLTDMLHTCFTIIAVSDASEQLLNEPVLQRAKDQLDEYFGGVRLTFDLPLLLVGTPFRQSVWRAIAAISYGQTVSYSVLANGLGKRPSEQTTTQAVLGNRAAGARAVASAVAANPISIFVPCHRVIAADGSLTGYAGGLDAKAFLLDLEKSRLHLCLNK
ncbi:MAG: methylated-DNA--[protein]-cysteine S-methyltransferase [Muribaculaceae bacterium]|nr:methylated-DNA--[protein]-cysteine S-methyltransferase [Muribaculaceae bacterium]